MKIILLEDVRKVGRKDEILEVSDGYANNYLIKNKLAVPYTKRSKEVLDIKLEQENIAEEEKIASAKQIKESLENKVIKFKVKTGAEDRVFGKISTKQISEELKKIGYDIDKKNIKITHDLDSLGMHDILITLHKKVEFTLKVNLTK